jgi:hypothetical protein
MFVIVRLALFRLELPSAYRADDLGSQRNFRKAFEDYEQPDETAWKKLVETAARLLTLVMVSLGRLSRTSPRGKSDPSLLALSMLVASG